MQTDFASVAALSDEAQVQLLETGDAPERLWAAWALALRHGRVALSNITALSDNPLTEGLKRQLLVIIAGLGARPVLRAIAMNDPVPIVRATAAAYYIRTAADGDSGSVNAFAIDQLRSGIPELVLALLGEHEASRIDLPDDEVIACLRDSHLEIRQGAVQCILSRDAVSERARDGLLRLLAGEESPPLTDQLLDYLPRNALPLLVRFLKSAQSKRIVDILGRVTHKFGPLSWAELRDLVSVPEPLAIDAILRALDVPVPSEAVAWLGSTYVACLPSSDRIWRDIQWRTQYALRKSISEENVNLLGAAATTSFRKELQEELAYFNSIRAQDLEEHDYSEDDGVELSRLLALLTAAG